MKVYKKCDCEVVLLDWNSGKMGRRCNKCNNGYIETKIPIEQALEALNIVDTYFSGGPLPRKNVSITEKVKDAIKALEECIK